MCGSSAVVQRTCDWHGYADAEELRMLHVIATFAADEALVHGAYGAAFRGFHVREVREVMASGTCVKLTVTGRQGYCAADDLAYCAVMLNADEFEERWHAQFCSC